MKLLRRIAVAAACVAVPLAAPRGAAAFHAPGVPVAAASASAGALTFSVEGSAGALAGTAYERVYEYSGGEQYKISQLDWEIERVAVAGFQAGIDFGGRFSANFGFWTAVDEGSGSMVDRDWIYAPPWPPGTALPRPWSVSDGDWTHESRHPQTDLEEASIIGDTDLLGLSLLVYFRVVAIAETFNRKAIGVRALIRIFIGSREVWVSIIREVGFQIRFPVAALAAALRCFIIFTQPRCDSDDAVTWDDVVVMAADAVGIGVPTEIVMCIYIIHNKWDRCALGWNTCRTFHAVGDMAACAVHRGFVTFRQCCQRLVGGGF